MRRFAILLILIAGCIEHPQREDGDDVSPSAEVVARLDDHESRISALEGGDPPSPGPSPVIDGWAKLSYDAAVATAHIKADICREAASKQFGSPKEVADWLRAEIPKREEAAYKQVKAAFALKFASGWTWAEHRKILLEQAEGYSSVR